MWKVLWLGPRERSSHECSWLILLLLLLSLLLEMGGRRAREARGLGDAQTAECLSHKYEAPTLIPRVKMKPGMVASTEILALSGVDS